MSHKLWQYLKIVYWKGQSSVIFTFGIGRVRIIRVWVRVIVWTVWKTRCVFLFFLFRIFRSCIGGSTNAFFSPSGSCFFLRVGYNLINTLIIDISSSYLNESPTKFFIYLFAYLFFSLGNKTHICQVHAAW